MTYYKPKVLACPDCFECLEDCECVEHSSPLPLLVHSCCFEVICTCFEEGLKRPSQELTFL